VCVYCGRAIITRRGPLLVCRHTHLFRFFFFFHLFVLAGMNRHTHKTQHALLRARHRCAGSSCNGQDIPFRMEYNRRRRERWMYVRKSRASVCVIYAVPSSRRQMRNELKESPFGESVPKKKMENLGTGFVILFCYFLKSAPKNIPPQRITAQTFRIR
jgi:hypothetical protein